jgi:hypothetical protein
MKRAPSQARIPVLALALSMGLLAGCDGVPPFAERNIVKERSDMRTEVPLVRSLDPTGPAEIQVEFDLPKQGGDETPPVFIGVRITGADATAVADLADRLVRTDIVAFLQLERIDPSGATKVELQRSQRIDRERDALVPLPADGMAAGLFHFDADVTTMQEAGLFSLTKPERALAFAFSPSLQEGRYRLKLRFDRHREALVEAHAQLLIAYTSKGK